MSTGVDSCVTRKRTITDKISVRREYLAAPSHVALSQG